MEFFNAVIKTIAIPKAKETKTGVSKRLIRFVTLKCSSRFAQLPADFQKTSLKIPKRTKRGDVAITNQRIPILASKTIIKAIKGSTNITANAAFKNNSTNFPDKLQPLLR